MSVPTVDEIKTESALLAEMKPTVRKTSMFGDNHHDAIDGQVTVLDGRLTDSQIYDEFEDGPHNVLEAALEARRWLDGEEDGKPSDDWEELVQ